MNTLGGGFSPLSPLSPLSRVNIQHTLRQSFKNLHELYQKQCQEQKSKLSPENTSDSRNSGTLNATDDTSVRKKLFSNADEELDSIDDDNDVKSNNFDNDDQYATHKLSDTSHISNKTNDISLTSDINTPKPSSELGTSSAFQHDSQNERDERDHETGLKPTDSSVGDDYCHHHEDQKYTKPIMKRGLIRDDSVERVITYSQFTSRYHGDTVSIPEKGSPKEEKENNLSVKFRKLDPIREKSKESSTDAGDGVVLQPQEEAPLRKTMTAAEKRQLLRKSRSKATEIAPDDLIDSSNHQAQKNTVHEWVNSSVPGDTFSPSTSMCHDDGPDTSQKEGPKDRSSVIRTASMEDDLSLGAEGSHMYSTYNNPAPVYPNGQSSHLQRLPSLDSGFVGVHDVRTRRAMYRQAHSSMFSSSFGSDLTHSGSSQTVSSIDMLLEQRKEDPEEILENLGFGSSADSMASRLPIRFVMNPSSAQGINVDAFVNQHTDLRVQLEDYHQPIQDKTFEVLTALGPRWSFSSTTLSAQSAASFNHHISRRASRSLSLEPSSMTMHELNRSKSFAMDSPLSRKYSVGSSFNGSKITSVLNETNRSELEKQGFYDLPNLTKDDSHLLANKRLRLLKNSESEPRSSSFSGSTNLSRARENAIKAKQHISDNKENENVCEKVVMQNEQKEDSKKKGFQPPPLKRSQTSLTFENIPARFQKGKDHETFASRTKSMPAGYCKEAVESDINDNHTEKELEREFCLAQAQSSTHKKMLPERFLQSNNEIANNAMNGDVDETHSDTFGEVSVQTNETINVKKRKLCRTGTKAPPPDLETVKEEFERSMSQKSIDLNAIPKTDDYVANNTESNDIDKTPALVSTQHSGISLKTELENSNTVTFKESTNLPRVSYSNNNANSEPSLVIVEQMQSQTPDEVEKESSSSASENTKMLPSNSVQKIRQSHMVKQPSLEIEEIQREASRQPAQTLIDPARCCSAQSDSSGFVSQVEGDSESLSNVEKSKTRSHVSEVQHNCDVPLPLPYTHQRPAPSQLPSQSSTLPISNSPQLQSSVPTTLTCYFLEPADELTTMSENGSVNHSHSCTMSSPLSREFTREQAEKMVVLKSLVGAQGKDENTCQTLSCDHWVTMKPQQKLLEEAKLVHQSIQQYKNILGSLKREEEDHMEELPEDDFNELQELRSAIQLELNELELNLSHRMKSIISGHLHSSLTHLEIISQVISLLKEQQYHKTIMPKQHSKNPVQSPQWSGHAFTPVTPQHYNSPSSAPAENTAQEMLDKIQAVKAEVDQSLVDMRTMFNNTLEELKASILEDVQLFIQRETRALRQKVKEKDQQLQLVTNQIQDYVTGTPV